jgi:hypothetical protein
MVMASILVALTACTTGGSSRTDPLGLLVLEGHVETTTSKVGEPVWLTIVLTNQLGVDVLVPCLSGVPTSTNAETIGITLVAVYRDGREGGSIPVVSKPNPELPHALPFCKIGPGKIHAIKTDATKWSIEGGWVRGVYRASAQMESIHVSPYLQMTVLTNKLFEFRIE